MRHLAAFLGCVCLLPFVGAAPAARPTNLLVNGGFEDGPEEIGAHLALEKGSDAIKGWKVTRGQIDIVGSFWQPAAGKRSVDLHGSPGYGGVEQTFKTKKGNRYRVELQLAATPGAGERSIWVAAAGDRKQFDVDPGDSTRDKMKWTKVTCEFTAMGAETTLEIYTTEKGDGAQGPIIDEVVVTEK
jgi:choice-of-anchor C domain-containing protein